MNENRPTLTDLVSAVREYLRHLSAKRLEGRDAFFARVAANILDVVEREIVHGPQVNAKEQKRLERLLDRGGSLAVLNAELCKRIREKDIDTGDERLIEHLRLTVMGRMSIDNPHYASYKRLIQEHGELDGEENNPGSPE